MSDTDDTDVLLLIPPTFFHISSSGSDDSLLQSSRTVVQKSPSCTARVLGKLVDQVHSLENRLESLEINSEVSSSAISEQKTWDFQRSFDSISITRKSSTFPRRRQRKNYSRKRPPIDLSLTSFDSVSTHQQSIPPLSLTRQPKLPTLYTKNIDDTLSMDGDLSSIVSTPSKNNDKLLLNEIDEFLTKVDAYESPETKYRAQDCMESEDVIKAAGDYIAQKIDTKSGDEKSREVLDKYIYLLKNNPELASQDKSLTSLNTYNTLYSDSGTNMNRDSHSKQSDENQKAVAEAKSPSVRKLNFLDSRKDIQQTSTPKRAERSVNSFKPSSNKVYERASKVLEQYKQNHSSNQPTMSGDTSYMMSPKKDEFKVPQGRPYLLDNRDGPKLSILRNKLLDTIDTELLSLSDLWGDKKENIDVTNLQKLEEEKMKREHCETLIQELQRKVLDQQERLAVAVKVDRNKDAVIIKLRDAWVKLTSGLDRTEDRHKQMMDKMNREVEHFRSLADEAQKKTQHYESELYKALDLAHDYQEKCKHFANAHMELKNDMDRTITHRDEIIRNKDKEIEVLRDNYDTAIRMNKQSTDCVKSIEASCEKEKHEHELTKMKLNDVMLTIQSMQEEINNVKQERDLLKEKANEERAKWNMAENQLAEKQNQNCELLRKCDTLDSEVKALRKHLEVQKNELKCHYQRQLEEAVLTKLQEFQQQLQQAEADMANEGKGNERAIIEAFNKQIHRIEEQHKLEIKIMEEKHKEEIKLYRLQLTQTNERVESLESKLSTFRERRSQLAEQLHGVMEAQWRQALNILTHPDTSRLHLTRSDAVSSPDPLDYAPPKIPPLVAPTAGRVTSQRRTDRRTDSHMFNFEALSDNELQQYVKLLLTRPPNVNANDTDRDLSETEDRKEVVEEPTSDRPDKDKSKKRGFNASKPPWKA